MEKEFIPYEQALALKELGFDEPCFGWWFADEEMLIIDKSTKSTSENIIQAPTFSQAFRWFRDNYNIDCYIRGRKSMSYEFIISGIAIPNSSGKNTKNSYFVYDTYEEAELACLIKLIEIVKNK
jgi:hypothetical protein